MDNLLVICLYVFQLLAVVAVVFQQIFFSRITRSDEFWIARKCQLQYVTVAPVGV